MKINKSLDFKHVIDIYIHTHTLKGVIDTFIVLMCYKISHIGMGYRFKVDFRDFFPKEFHFSCLDFNEYVILFKNI